MTFDPIPVKIICVNLPKDHYVQVPWKHNHFSQKKTLAKSQLPQMTPTWTLTPISIEVTCATLPKDHCVQLPWKYMKVCGYSDHFFKNFN